MSTIPKNFGGSWENVTKSLSSTTCSGSGQSNPTTQKDHGPNDAPIDLEFCLDMAQKLQEENSRLHELAETLFCGNDEAPVNFDALSKIVEGLQEDNEKLRDASDKWNEHTYKPYVPGEYASPVASTARKADSRLTDESDTPANENNLSWRKSRPG